MQPEMKRNEKGRILQRMWRDRFLYLMIFPTVLYFLIFRVWPIFNMRLAFFEYKAKGPWQFVGFKYFKMIFSTTAFASILRNTLIISFMKYVLLFPSPFLNPRYLMRCMTQRIPPAICVRECAEAICTVMRKSWAATRSLWDIITMTSSRRS